VICRYDLSAIPHDDMVHEKYPGQKELRTSTTVYLMRLPGSSPSVVINNKAVALCLEGKFPEAEVLLLQIPERDRVYAAVINNLGVVYECSGEFAKARDCFFRAGVLDPSRSIYLDNLRTADRNGK
jgi:Flp pilus assembly protein TadD